MPTVRIKLHPRFTEHEVKVIRERAAMIVSGSGNNYEVSTRRWSIDVDGNNWWYVWDEKHKTVSIQSRYAGDDILIHVKEILIWAFNLENFNQAATAPRREESSCEQEPVNLIRWNS